MYINHIQDGLFRAAHGWSGGKKTPLPKICHTYPVTMKLGTVIRYLKKIQRLLNHMTHPLSSSDISTFFTGNQPILLYQEIQIYIPFRYLISNSSNFSWVFKDCFNKHGHNFDDVSKNGCPGLLKIKVFWKRLWRHTFCPWRHQQNFITWFKCGYVTKVW